MAVSTGAGLSFAGHESERLADIASSERHTSRTPSVVQGNTPKSCSSGRRRSETAPATEAKASARMGQVLRPAPVAPRRPDIFVTQPIVGDNLAAHNGERSLPASEAGESVAQEARPLAEANATAGIGRASARSSRSYRSAESVDPAVVKAAAMAAAEAAAARAYEEVIRASAPSRYSQSDRASVAATKAAPTQPPVPKGITDNSVKPEGISSGAPFRVPQRMPGMAPQAYYRGLPEP